MAVLAVTVTMSVQAGRFECKDVAANAAGHQHVFQSLIEKLGIEPVEFAYCEHKSSPRWVARWIPFEEFNHEGEIWRRYATARCFDYGSEFKCHVTNHVVAGDSHVVVDIKKCDISIAALADIHGAVAKFYPGYEMKQIEFVTVTDGGAWSPSGYGYNVRLIELPKFEGGLVRRFIQRCEPDACTWQDSGGGGSWIGGSSYLPKLRRTRGDPMIDIIQP